MPRSRAFKYPVGQTGDKNRLSLEIDSRHRSGTNELFQEIN